MRGVSMPHRAITRRRRSCARAVEKLPTSRGVFYGFCGDHMDSSNALAEVITAPPVLPEDTRPAAILRGTARGLEIHVHGLASVDAIAAAVLKRLDEAPSFFRGSDVRIRVEDGPLAAGCLARLDAIAGTYELRIVEVGAAQKAARVADDDAVPQPNLAAGSAPAPASTTGFEDAPTHTAAAAYVPAPALVPSSVVPADKEPVTLADADLVELTPSEAASVGFEEPTQTAVPLALAATPEIELETITEGTRLVVGPVRSGVILEHSGHLIVFGDVNPGAEIRAEGNIVVLGRLRGTAHAGIGQDVGFILALRLEPQQLRIGRKVARAADSDTPAAEPEIAYVHGRRDRRRALPGQAASQPRHQHLSQHPPKGVTPWVEPSSSHQAREGSARRPPPPTSAPRSPSSATRSCSIDADIGLRNLDVVMGLENRIVYHVVDAIRGKCSAPEGADQGPPHGEPVAAAGVADRRQGRGHARGHAQPRVRAQGDATTSC